MQRDSPNPEVGEVTRLLEAVKQEGRPAEDSLMEVVYGELHRLARSRLSHEASAPTLNPTALVNEAFLKVVGQEDADINSKTHFVAIASMAMQRILVDHARAKGTRKRGGDRDRKQLHENIAEKAIEDEEALGALAEAVERVDRNE